MKAEVKIKVKVAQHPHLRFSGRNGTRLQIVKLLYGGLAGTRGKGSESGEVACAPDEGLYMELVDSAAGPETALAEILVIAVDLGEAGEGGGITVLTILHD